MSASMFRFVLLGMIVVTLGLAGSAGYFGTKILHEKVAASTKIKIDAKTNSDAQLSAEKARQELNEPEKAKLAEFLEKVIPEAEYRNQFLADVNKYAAESGVPLTSLSYPGDGRAPAIQGTVAVPIQLTLGSDIPYDNFINFVEKLENNLQHVQVLNLNMQPQEDDRSILSSASLTIALYVEG